MSEDEQEYTEEDVGSLTLEILDVIDKKYREPSFAWDMDYFRKVKIGGSSLLEFAARAKTRHEMYLMKSKDEIKKSNKLGEHLAELLKQLDQLGPDEFYFDLKTTILAVVDHLTSANASSAQLMVLNSFIVPKLLDEQGKIQRMGIKDYLNQQAKDEVKDASVALMTILNKYGMNPEDLIAEAVEKERKERESLRVIARSTEEAKQEILEREVFAAIIERTDFEKKKFPKKTEIYDAVPRKHDEVNDAMKRMVSRGLLKVSGRGRGVAKRVIPQSREFIPDKVHPQESDKYANSRENTSPNVPSEHFEKKNEQKKLPIQTEGVMEGELNQEEDYAEGERAGGPRA